MTSRAADATIKGYYYQFDTSILNLLKLTADNDTIDIEGIEDIDVNTEADTTVIQCKYLSKPKFINSAVKEPIILMLDHFVNPATANNLNYRLYAHFEQETPGLTASIDLNKLKAILTYSEYGVSKCYYTDNGISDAVLISFLSQFKLIFGYKFEDQQHYVIGKLKTKFSCSEFEADTHFYNNALRVVIDIAKEPTISKRRISKKDFISAINRREKLFNEWYIRLRSKKEYLKKIADNLKSSKALDHSRAKFIFIGDDLFAADNSELPILSLIENLINEYYKLNVVLRSAKPLTLILGCDNVTLIDLKKSMLTNLISFNDGYEHIEFNVSIFNNEPIINRNANGSKIIQASFTLKIISLHTFITNLTSLKMPKVILHFSKNDCPCPKDSNYQWFDIKYCENLKDIATLII